MGPKIGVWIGGGMAMGLNLIYYTNFDKNSLVCRPEIGMGIEKFKLVYGYNWRWTKSLLLSINTRLGWPIVLLSGGLNQ